MHEAPQPPRGRTPQFDPAEIGDGRLTADGGETAEVSIDERRGRRFAFYACLNDASNVSAALLGRRREARHGLTVPCIRQRGIADRVHSLKTDDTQVRADFDSAG